jgi:hypothetical protein
VAATGCMPRRGRLRRRAVCWRICGVRWNWWRCASLSCGAKRWRINSLEQLRSIFDQSGLGMVLIGMPGIEKRVARYPQFFSRIGFVHEFRALSDADIQVLLEQRWAPEGIHLPAPPLAPEVIAAVIRLTPEPAARAVCLRPYKTSEISNRLAGLRANEQYHQMCG